RGITLQTADQKQFDLQLELGSTAAEVEVTAETPLIDTTAATSGTVITSQDIAELPSISRIATIMATLAPAVFQQDQNQNVAHRWSHDAASQISVDGGDMEHLPKLLINRAAENNSMMHVIDEHLLDLASNRVRTLSQVTN